MGMIRYLTGFVFVAIFAVAIIGYSIGFSTDNSADVNLNTDSDLTGISGNVKGDLGSYKTSADTSFNILVESTISSGDDNVEGGGQFKTGPTDIISTAKNIITSTNKKIFGEGNEFSFIFTTILAFIGFISGLYIWKTWKSGSPD